MTAFTRRRTVLSLTLPFTIAGCNYFLDLDTSQCSVTSDCQALGAAFEGTVCVAGSCVANQLSAGASGVREPAADEGGAGGAPSSGGCTSNADCVAANMDEPYACLVPGEECVPLKTEECPLVFGDYLHDNAVYFGAFLNVPATSPLSQMSTLNVRLAVDEFNGSVGGLPGGTLGKLRPLVGVICRNDSSLIEAGAAHLIDELHVPAILSHLASADNKRFFVDHALDEQILVVNPGFADNSLTALSNGGLFWHVIGDVRDVGPAYVPLLARIETHLAKTEPLRVALLVSKRYTEESIANTITPILRFNGKSVIENGADFFSVSVPALADEPNADYAAVNQSLLAFRPHVVLALTREEFVYKILPAVEGGWSSAAPGQSRPFYVLPNSLSGNLDLLNYVGLDSGANTSEMKRKRFIGVAPASAEDLTLYNQFLVRFRTAYPRFESPGGFENFYDAVYLLANAMFAAGSVPALTGPDIARGMQRIIGGNLPIDVGPTTIADGFAALAAGGNIRLNGTMGPADFDPGVGARRSNGSVYCIQRTGPQLSFAYDVLRYDRSKASLRGEFPCFSGF
jgi:branched-chain amino acid transport system substrate-binding protein